jgi:IS30 family transposase
MDCVVVSGKVRLLVLTERMNRRKLISKIKSKTRNGCGFVEKCRKAYHFTHKFLTYDDDENSFL